MSLYDFAMEYGTDKSSHGYCPHYEKFLSEYIDKECTLLEMGIADGKSLKMWRRWLPKSKVVGFDQDEGCKGRAASSDYEIVIGRQENTDDLRKLVQGRFFDIIIDDAGHNMNEQLVAFHFLFDHVYPGGWYVIEDVDVDHNNESIPLEVTRPVSIVSIVQGESKIKELHLIVKNRGSCILFMQKR